MTQDRIQYFENLLKKPMAEPHRGYIEELFAEVTGKTKHAAVMVHKDGSQTELGTVKPDSIRINGKRTTASEAKQILDNAPSIHATE